MKVERAGEYRFTWNGDDIRVIVAGDVVSIPGWAGSPGWSMGGFGGAMTVEWLLHEGGLSGPKLRRRALASMIVSALAAYHGGAPAQETSAQPRDPRGPFVKCPTCVGPMPGWVPAPAGYKGPALVIVDAEAS